MCGVVLYYLLLSSGSYTTHSVTIFCLCAYFANSRDKSYNY